MGVLTVQGSGVTDNFMTSSGPTTQDGSNVDVVVGPLFGSPNYYRGLVKFDISSIPSNATIISAILTLWTSTDFSDRAGVVEVYRVLQAWVENESTWNIYATGHNWATAGCDNTTTDREASNIGTVSVAGPITINTQKDITLDVSKIQEMISGGGFTNNGFLLKNSNESDWNGGHVFHSTNYAGDATKTPKLVVTYIVPSPSSSPSSSLSASPSSSISASPSSSPSPSSSVSASPSSSPSSSVSASPSVTGSPSPSASPSSSPSSSASQTPSSSVSHSMSSSVSSSPSPSSSPSSSLSPSQAPGSGLFSKEAIATLPLTKENLAILYGEEDEDNVATDDAVRVSLTSLAGFFMIHQYRVINNNNKDDINVRVNLQSTLAPSSSPVYLQIWNVNTGLWQTLVYNNTEIADTDFDLEYLINTNVENYYDSDNEVALRVYQYDNV